MDLWATGLERYVVILRKAFTNVSHVHLYILQIMEPKHAQDTQAVSSI